MLDLCSFTSKILFCVLKPLTFSLSIFFNAMLFRHGKSTIKTFFILGLENGWVIFIIILTAFETKWWHCQHVCENVPREVSRGVQSHPQVWVTSTYALETVNRVPAFISLCFTLWLWQDELMIARVVLLSRSSLPWWSIPSNQGKIKPVFLKMIW